MLVHLIRTKGVSDELYFGCYEFLNHFVGPYNFELSDKPRELTIKDEIRIVEPGEALEYENVLVNPRLYYFSSALKLHHRVKKAKELGLGKNWPSQPAAPANIFDLIKEGKL